MLSPFTEDIPISAKELTLARDLAGFVLAAQQTLAVDKADLLLSCASSEMGGAWWLK